MVPNWHKSQTLRTLSEPITSKSIKPWVGDGVIVVTALLFLAHIYIGGPIGLVGSKFRRTYSPAAPSNPKTNISPDATNAARNAVLSGVHTVGEFPDNKLLKKHGLTWKSEKIKG